MNNKLTATLIALLIISQGYINYKLIQTQQLQAVLTWVATNPIEGNDVINTLVQDSRKRRGMGLSGFDTLGPVYNVPQTAN